MKRLVLSLLLVTVAAPTLNAATPTLGVLPEAVVTDKILSCLTSHEVAQVAQTNKTARDRAREALSLRILAIKNNPAFARFTDEARTILTQEIIKKGCPKDEKGNYTINHILAYKLCSRAGHLYPAHSVTYKQLEKLARAKRAEYQTLLNRDLIRAREIIIADATTSPVTLHNIETVRARFDMSMDRLKMALRFIWRLENLSADRLDAPNLDALPMHQILVGPKALNFRNYPQSDQRNLDLQMITEFLIITLQNRQLGAWGRFITITGIDDTIRPYIISSDDIIIDDRDAMQAASVARQAELDALFPAINQADLARDRATREAHERSENRIRRWRIAFNIAGIATSLAFAAYVYTHDRFTSPSPTTAFPTPIVTAETPTFCTLNPASCQLVPVMPYTFDMAGILASMAAEALAACQATAWFPSFC